MQQIYYCPYCGAPAVYGQPQCSSCQTAFNWESAPAQDQYQSSSYQYPDQQQQWYQYYTYGQQAGQDASEQTKQPAGAAAARVWEQVKNNRGTIIKILAAVVVVSVLTVAGIFLQGEIKKWTAPPVLTAFEISSPSITKGQEATLQWSVSGANSIILSPGIGAVPPLGTRKVSPETRTTYTLMASNSFGSATKSVTLDVTGVLPAVNSFKLSSDNIYAGQTAKISWNVTGATGISISPEIGPVSASGTREISPRLTTTYVLTASNNAGNTTATVTLKVTVSDAPIITTFSISPESIKAGESATLTWDVINAKSININEGIGGVAAKGTLKVNPAATAIYTLMAGNDYSSTTISVKVTVDTSNINNPDPSVIKTPPDINSFKASKQSIMLGDNITLNWTVSRARTVSISHGIGSVPDSGWTMVIPTGTTTYTLSATNTFGTQTADITVTVNKSSDGDPPEIKSFAAAPTSIASGATSRLSWDIKGATIVILDQGIGIPDTKYSHSVSPSVTTAYTLTAINSYGTDNATVTVSVIP